MQNPIAIQFRNVTKSFGNKKILDQLNLDIPSARFVSIVGPSGCGKSTLLRLVAGLETVDSGQLFTGAQGSSREDIAFVFQEATLLPWLTTLENVSLPFRITGQTLDRQKVVKALNRVGLPPEVHQKYPKHLSGGMKMRVSIARALVREPKILLLDEPFAALDDILRTSLNLELANIWEQKKLTILFVTHNIAEALFVSQEVIVMRPSTGTTQSIEIPFGYPRDKKIRSSNEFAKLYSRVSEKLEGDSA
ncbi:MAG: ABC transporter ATP-binding protein [Planctomycetota bacterium]|nr:ABC transporter ATP-binding protein [Planctomycetota bacterium]